MTRLDWAKRVPILDVARALGLEIAGPGSARCWRKANHARADRDPSLGLDTTANRYKCWVCDPRAASTVDLVMACRGLDLATALDWFATHFNVLADVRDPDHFDSDAWRHASLESVVKCGVWAALSDSWRTILVVLWVHRDANGLVRMSYSRILRLAGLSSRKTVCAAIEHFEKIHLLEVERADRQVSIYRFVEHPEFCEQQRQSLEALRLVPFKGTSSKESKENLVPPEGTSEMQTGSPMRELRPLGRCVREPVPLAGTRCVEREMQVLRLARRGFALFPCKPRAKQPAVPWRKLATADSKKLARWFQEMPDANWAIATGPVSRIFVLDVDGEAGRASFLELRRKHGALDTLGVKTARGWHLYFRYPATGIVRNSAGKLGRGLDVRGVGGYALAPPSTHPDGTVYAWLDGQEEAPIAAAPQWLMEAITGSTNENAQVEKPAKRSPTELLEHVALDPIVQMLTKKFNAKIVDVVDLREEGAREKLQRQAPADFWQRAIWSDPKAKAAPVAHQKLDGKPGKPEAPGPKLRFVEPAAYTPKSNLGQPRQCSIHGVTSWWRRPDDSAMLCDRCHPSPNDRTNCKT